MPQNTSVFTTFGTQHLVTVLIIAALMIGLPYQIKKRDSEKAIRIGALVLAVFLMSIKIGEPLLRTLNGETLHTILPLHLCDVAAILTCFFFLKQNMFMFELMYFWGLGGGIQAVLTPDLPVGFPSARFMFYFLTHGLCMIGVIYAIVLFDYRPVLKSIWRTYLATLGYAIVIIPINFMLDTNYLYLMKKPQKATLLDYLGTWPWYILNLVGVCFVIYFIYYSPFLIKDFIKKQKS